MLADLGQGCPAASPPGGLPVGPQVVGPPRAERRVLGVAAAFEAATGHGRRRPAIEAEALAAAGPVGS